ncbi:hypothetical protein HX792_04990 [Pseudomonas sp. B6002]|uniref:hypothetical protein n=1 Tax=Pseudomonas sp. B6002 TaxID=2726978 RepID=UPI0015A2F7E7|nr:hypothetical protein [Pseudomonas sp. B6002]NVZ49683.1 hypothetical protein [Pseudomonas sp. B6002]
MNSYGTSRALILVVIIIGMMISPFARSDARELYADISLEVEPPCLEDVSQIKQVDSEAFENELIVNGLNAPERTYRLVQLCPVPGASLERQG